MAINPGADLLSDALLAAEPQRVKAAEDRLARIAAEGGAESIPFDSLLAAPGTAENAPLTSFTPPRMTNSGLFSVKQGNAYRQFEVTVLKTMFDEMLPQKAAAVYGTGFAGSVWKSMLAQSMAEVAGEAGGVGLATALEARRKKVAAAG
jgi:peptidoglycan hydrolase FlgJ